MKREYVKRAILIWTPQHIYSLHVSRLHVFIGSRSTTPTLSPEKPNHANPFRAIQFREAAITQLPPPLPPPSTSPDQTASRVPRIFEFHNPPPPANRSQTANHSPEVAAVRVPPAP